MENLKVYAHRVSYRIKHGGAIFKWVCVTSRGMGCMCNKTGKMTQGLYRVMKTTEWYCFNAYCLHGIDPKLIAKLVKQWLSMIFFFMF